jgi:hypothetical protein
MRLERYAYGLCRFHGYTMRLPESLDESLGGHGQLGILQRDPAECLLRPRECCKRRGDSVGVAVQGSSQLDLPLQILPQHGIDAQIDLGSDVIRDQPAGDAMPR